MQYEVNDSVKTLLFLTIVIGVIFGIFINPMSTEHIEFAQTLAGLIKISSGNSFFLVRQSDPSLQVVLPALLLKSGFSVFFLTFISSIVSQVIPFLCLALLIYHFTERIEISLIGILILLNTYSGFNHYYNLSFPADFFVFGNLATWFSALVIAFYLNSYKKTASFLAGLMFSIHLVWAISSIVFYLIYLIKEKNRKPLILFFIFGLMISISSYLAFDFMKKNYFEKSIYQSHEEPPVVEITTVETLPKETVLPKAKTLRSTFQAHNPVIFTGNFQKDIDVLGNLLQYSAILLLLTLMNLKSKILAKEKVLNLATPYLFIFIFGILGLVFIDFAPSNYLTEKLFPLVLRAIPNRFFNLSYVFVHVLFIASYSKLFLNSKNYIFKFILLYVFLKYIERPYEHQILMLSILALSSKIEKFLNNRFSNEIWRKVAN